MRREVTNYVLLGSKSHGGLFYTERIRSEQSVWRANTEARRINEYCNPEIYAPQRNCSRDVLLSVDLCLTGEDRCLTGRNGQKHCRSSRGMGSGICGKIFRDNDGKVLLQIGKVLTNKDLSYKRLIENVRMI